MSHLLIIELPGGNDADIVQAAIARGDEFTFLSAQLSHYRIAPAVMTLLATARGFIEVPAFEPAEVERRVLAVHAQQPFDAVLCLVDRRLVDAARLARRLGLPHLNPETAALLLARTRPTHPEVGRRVGCDTISSAGRHRLLGVHELLPFEPPSPALRGCTFTPCSGEPEFAGLEAWVRVELDAVGFDWGAAHLELVLTAAGPRLLAIQPRLVGCKIARLVGYALGRSLHADLIALHTGLAVAPSSGAAPQVAVLRWIVAEGDGVLDEVLLPPWQDPAIRCVEILRQPGDAVRAQLHDPDRLGYVMVCGPTREDAEALADRFVARTLVRLHPPQPRLEFEALPPLDADSRPAPFSSLLTWPLPPTLPTDFSKAAS